MWNARSKITVVLRDGCEISVARRRVDDSTTSRRTAALDNNATVISQQPLRPWVKDIAVKPTGLGTGELLGNARMSSFGIAG